MSLKYFLKVMMGRLASHVLHTHDCPILMYHRVMPYGTVPNTLDKNVVVTPQNLETNLLWVLKYFSVVPLSDVIAGRQSAKPSCVITFDDGWLDTYEVAFPILRRLGVPATVFLPTAYIGTLVLFWFDRVERLVRHWVSEDGLIEACKQCVSYFPVKLTSGIKTEAELFYETVHLLKPHHPTDIGSWLDQAEGRTYGSPQPISPCRRLMDWDEV